jgi:hypothetical protein
MEMSVAHNIVYILIFEFMCWSVSLNRLFHSDKKGVWTKTMAHYTSYCFRDIEAVVKKLASVVVKGSTAKNQVSFVILCVVNLTAYILVSLEFSGGMTKEQ